MLPTVISTMFAQLQSADPVHLRDFLIITVVIIGTLTNVVTMLKSRESQKREVSFTADFATREQVREVKAAAEIAVRDARGEISELKESLTRIHERIDDIEKDLGTVPERVIAQLLNSRALFERKMRDES